MDEEYMANAAADEIVEALLSGKWYPIQIDKPTYDGIYSRLLSRFPNLRPSVFLHQGVATVQFSGISPAKFEVIGTHKLTREHFTNTCAIREGTKSLTWWPKTLVLDVSQLKWYLFPICLIGLFLLALQTPEDLHNYFILIAQILAIVFTLYAVLRQSFKGVSEKELPDQELIATHQNERVIGVTGIGSIVLCLLGFLLTSPSTADWDTEHLLSIVNVHLQLFRWTSVAVGIVLIVLLASFFKSIVFYYPDMDFGQTLLRISDRWFKEQHFKASKSIRDIKDDSQYT